MNRPKAYIKEKYSNVKEFYKGYVERTIYISKDKRKTIIPTNNEVHINLRDIDLEI